MFRPFQVNEGRFIPLKQDLPPTARVSELCSAVSAVSNEAEEDQVMLTSEGKQMNPAEMIGAYSVGTEGKPIFVFYRSYLSSSQPPISPSRIPHRSAFKLQLELLNQKPTPSLFQNLVVLSKRLSEYGVSIGGLCGQLSEEYQLQYSGWCTALANCDAIIKTYHKHHKLFSKEVDTFRSTKTEYLQLLQEFPQKVELLQQLPMPSAIQNQNPSSSLYDWINTHDERNNLLDLNKECKKALSNIESSSIDAALLATQHITEEATKLHSQDEQFHSRVSELTALAKKTTEYTDTIAALAQNIKSTSNRAYRFGDAGTIADLVVSHHKSLQMMYENCAQLEAQAKELERSKQTLTRFIHSQLQQVAKLQERVAHSNSQLLLLHEHIKLAQKRFEILRQVCHTPQVLARVLSEVDRRMAFNSAFEKRAEEASSCLKQAREEEKQLRKEFVSNYGQHFIHTLFPELMERVPDVSIHLPRQISKSSQAYHSDHERIRQLLPPEMRPSPASASMQLLSSPLITSDRLPDSPVSPLSARSSLTNSETGGQAKLLLDSSVQTGGSLGPSEEKLKFEGLFKKMEADNNELRNNLSSCVIEKEQARQQLRESELTNMKVLTSLEMDKSRLQDELEICRRELSRKVDEKDKRVNQLESTNEVLLEKANQLGEELKQLETARQVMAHKMQLLEEEVKQLTAKNVQISTELKQRAQDIEALELERRDLSNKHDVEVKQKYDTVSRLEALNHQLSSQNESSKAEIEQLQDSILHLELTNKEYLVKKEAELTEVRSRWEKERSELKYQMTQHSADLEKCQHEKESLAVEVKRLSSVANALQLKEKETNQLSCEVEEAKGHREKLKKERGSLILENQNLRDQCKRLVEESSRQTSRHQQAQNTIASLKTQMAAAESKLKTDGDSLQRKLEASKKEIDHVQIKLKAAEGKVKELQSQMNLNESQHLKFIQKAKAEKEVVMKTNGQLQEEAKVLTEYKIKLQRRIEAEEQKLKEVSEKSRDEIKELNRQIRFKEVQSLESIQVEKTEKEMVVKERNRLEEKLTVLSKEKTELQRELDMVNEKLKKVSEGGRDEIKNLKSQLREKEMQMLNSVQMEKDKHEAMTKKNSELLEKVKALTEDEMNMKKKMEVLGNERNLLKKKLNEKELELEKIASERDGFHKQAMEQERELKELQKKLKEVRFQLQEKEMQMLNSVQTEKDKHEAMTKKNSELLEKVKALTEDEMNMKKKMEVLGNERNLLKKKLGEKELELEKIASERDGFHKQAMEQERELKELQRSFDSEATGRMQGPCSLEPIEPQLPLPEAMPTSSRKKVTVAITGLKDGDVALFISDKYDNYIALVTDEKIYYLNQGSIPRLNDLGALVPHLNLQRKVLIGRITGRMFVEVRKEGNRLKVPVGTRMYKLDAEYVHL